MNIDEFDALKEGDKVTNGNGDVATVVAKAPHGVQVRWGDNSLMAPIMLFRQSTIWFGLEMVAGATQEDDTGAVEGR